MADKYNDGDLKHGTSNITVSGTNTVFVVNSANFDDALKILKSYAGDGTPLKSAGTQDFLEGTLTIQFPTSSTPAPANGAHFTYDAFNDGSPGTWYIIKRGTKYQNENGESMIDISVQNKIN